MYVMLKNIFLTKLSYLAGMLLKRGYKVKHWKERWCVMTPREIKYYVTANEKDLKGVIEFDADCTVEVD